MSKLKTYLISGAGNTFHIVWNKAASQPATTSKQICKEQPADGFIFLNKNQQNEYTWDFYNNDGSAAEMCGNATRCVGFFVKNILNDASAEIYLQTLAGRIQIIPQNQNQFQVQMTEIQEFQHPVYFYCDTGVPHIVIERVDFDQYKDLKKFCSELRFHKDFLPRGTNVTLIKKTITPDLIEAVSYERGVEDFTLACGTGAMAAAFYNFKKYAVPVTHVKMPGGLLTMNLTNLQQPIMVGPAELIGEFEYENY